MNRVRLYYFQASNSTKSLDDLLSLGANPFGSTQATTLPQQAPPIPPMPMTGGINWSSSNSVTSQQQQFFSAQTAVVQPNGKFFYLLKNTALEFTVSTGGADFRFLALQPGSAMGVWGQPSCDFAYLTFLPSPDLSRYPFRAGSILA